MECKRISNRSKEVVFTVWVKSKDLFKKCSYLHNDNIRGDIVLVVGTHTSTVHCEHINKSVHLRPLIRKFTKIKIHLFFTKISKVSFRHFSTQISF